MDNSRSVLSGSENNCVYYTRHFVSSNTIVCLFVCLFYFCFVATVHLETGTGSAVAATVSYAICLFIICRMFTHLKYYTPLSLKLCAMPCRAVLCRAVSYSGTANALVHRAFILRRYAVVVTSHDSGLIEPIVDAVSLHQVKKHSQMSLLNYFIKVSTIS